MKNKLKTVINLFNDINNNTQQRGIMMLIIMSIFFLFVILLIRSAGPVPEKKVKPKSESELPFSLGKIKANNYHFVYTFDIDNNKAIYEGDSYKNKKVFSDKTNKYYKFNNDFLIDVNGVWSKTDCPYKYSELIEIDNIEKVLKSATYESKTEYNDSRKTYNYVISTTTLLKELKNKVVDLDDDVNKIIVNTRGKEVNELSFDIKPYSKYLDNVNITINLKYSKFGDIDKIEDPE